jgi:hypothetical protein
MNTTSSQLPICVHCGTPRPADETLCPTCGKPWIDTSIQPTAAPGVTPPAVAAATDTGDDTDAQDDGPPKGAVAAAAAAAAAAAHADKGESTTPAQAATANGSDTDTTDGADDDDSEADGPSETATDAAPAVLPPPPPPLGPDDTGEFAFAAWSQPPDDKGGSRSKAWFVPAGIIAAILVAVGILVFGGSTTTTTTTIAALSTTSTPETASTTSPPVATTTSPPATTTTVIAYPQPEDWPPIGDPIDIADLTLKQAAIGTIDLGTPIDDAAGALTASLGEATASGIDDLCPPDESYWLAFGQLTAIFDGFGSDSVFVSYRYNEPEGTDAELGLKTLSGIAIGDTVEDLINTYTQFTISFEIIDSKDHFRLSDGGELLLWGPVSSIDSAGLIEGIYSPTACDATP